MQVIMQANDRTSLPISSISLDHFATFREPLTAIGLDEKATCVAVDVGCHDIDTFNDV